jgi:hypothetical protein
MAIMLEKDVSAKEAKRMLDEAVEQAEKATKGDQDDE